MSTCIYMFRTLSRYINHCLSIIQISKLVRHADSESIIWIKQNQTKSRYLPSLFRVASNSSKNIQPLKATKQLVYMPTCTYMLPTLSRYTNQFHSITQECKLVRYADSELIICIKETNKPTKVQLIPHACHGIFTLVRWSHKATSKQRYWPSIHNVA